MSVLNLNSLYLALTATPAKVVEIMENDASNETEDRIIGYVEQFVGNMTQDTLRKPKVYWSMDSIDTFLANYFILYVTVSA